MEHLTIIPTPGLGGGRWPIAFVAQWIGRPPPERKVAGSSPAEGASPELESAVIRSCTRPAVSTDTKAAGAVVRPLPIQGVGRRPGYGGDPDRGSIPRAVRIRPVHSRWYGAGH